MDKEHQKFTINGKLAEDRNGNIFLHNIKKEDVKRNPEWPDLNWDEIDEAVDHHTYFEYLMCEGQCKTNEMAIKAINNYRKSSSELSDIIIDASREEKRNKYIRSHYNDTEDDNFERQEIRCLNG